MAGVQRAMGLLVSHVGRTAPAAYLAGDLARTGRPVRVQAAGRRALLLSRPGECDLVRGAGRHRRRTHPGKPHPVRGQPSVMAVRAAGYLPGGTIRVLFLASAFECFSARFSLRDLPAFLDMCCRGDLSAMTAPLVTGA